MKIISLTMVNNESEIIESFIRYNYNFVDEMIIVDNGCTDSTIRIINELIREGYKITVYDESLEAYNQFKLDNKYLDKIINEKDADLIIPLDTDEFITSDSNPREVLEQLDLNHVYYVNWQWYVITKEDNEDEVFVPLKMKYCLKNAPYNYSDGTPVTKVIIPAKYYQELHLTLSMGHHSVFGNNKVDIIKLDCIRFGHYRVISTEQLIYKTSCYTMRDIATMGNNFETAQRTNQMAIIENGADMYAAAVESSYGGYDKAIVYKPLDLSFCKKSKICIKYAQLAKENLASRVMATGREMAIRAYNECRSRMEKPFLKPIIFWLDGIRGSECIFPNPSNRLTILTQMYNVRALLTTTKEIRFLKANYRLIITPDFAKFIPHEFIVIPDTVNFEKTKEKIVEYGISPTNIITLLEYKKRLGLAINIYCKFLFIPSLLFRIFLYIRKNGTSNTLKKIQERLKKK